MLRVLLAALLLLGACGPAADAPVSPATAAPGTAARAGYAFFEVAQAGLLDADTLWFDGVRFDGVERWVEDGALVVRLRARDRLEGMRRLVFRPLDQALVERDRVFRALEVAAPRVASLALAVDGGASTAWLLVEHVGGAFLQDRFGTRDGALGSLPHVDTARAAPLRVDVDAALRFLAATRALGIDSEASAYDPCAPGGGCAAPIAALDAGPYIDAIDARLGPLGALLSDPEWHARFRDHLAEAAWLLDRPALDAWLRAADRGDPADRLPLGRPFLREGGTLLFRYRHAAGAPAMAATLEIAGEAYDLAHDPASDLWTARLPAPAGAVDWALTVDGVRVDGGTLRADRVDTLEHLRTTPVDVREPSGLAWDDGALVVVGDDRRRVYWIDPETGSRVDAIHVDAVDMEAVEVDPLTGELLVAIESSAEVWRISRTGQRLDRLRLGWAEDGNDGLEGLALRPSDGHLFVAKERRPARIAEFDEDGDRLSRDRVDFAADLSDLAWSATDDFLYAISDIDQRLYRLDGSLEVLASWPLPVAHPEGLAIVGDTVYVVSDTERTLLELRLWDR